jgi:hypothetical protein
MAVSLWTRQSAGMVAATYVEPHHPRYLAISTYADIVKTYCGTQYIGKGEAKYS